MVDQRAQRLAYEAFLNEYGLGKTVEHCFDVALAEYEAAKWRPIEEAPRDGTKICVWWAAGKGPIRDYPERMEFLWWERDCWISDLGGRALTHSGCVDVGAMFRTIDPPKQDAVSRATSTPPAAEASS